MEAFTPYLTITMNFALHQTPKIEMGGAESKSCEGLLIADECYSLDSEVVQQLLKSAGKLAAAAVVSYLLGHFVPAGFVDKAKHIFMAKKLMKSPGRKGVFILREAFENDPKAYFRNLCGKGL